MSTIIIGLALFNGARHLAEQLGSIGHQDWTDWRLILSDDGSSDDSLAIARAFAASRPSGQVVIVDGPRKGSAINFLSLLDRAPKDSFFAYSDQDDVWHPGKLSRAMSMLNGIDGPAVYGARTTVCDADLHPLAPSKRFDGPFDFANALIQCVVGGNTALLNPAALALAQQAAPHAAAAGIVAHDWWTYQIVTGAGGQVVRDNEQVLLYRQHGSNLMGRNDTASAMAARLSKLVDGEFGGWLNRNLAALRPVSHLLTAENRAILHEFDRALDLRGPRQAMILRRLGIHRQTLPANIAFYAASLAGRLRRSD